MNIAFELAKLLLGIYFEQMRVAGKTKEEVRTHFNETHEAFLALPDPSSIPDPE
jgi:hypothetical protein